MIAYIGVGCQGRDWKPEALLVHKEYYRPGTRTDDLEFRRFSLSSVGAIQGVCHIEQALASLRSQWRDARGTTAPHFVRLARRMARTKKRPRPVQAGGVSVSEWL